jgi:L-seryl-tRNA(Ser) seleniumtransferase
MKALRGLPKVDRLLQHERAEQLAREVGRSLLRESIRAVLGGLRTRARNGEDVGGVSEAEVLEEAARLARSKLHLRMRRVVNATGVILHTGLGRAVLAPAALAAIASEQRGYSLLEVDPVTGERGVREAAVSDLLASLTGAEAATVVNNNAAATLLALSALAAGREVICSHGQLVEIGGSFRMPEVMEASGARLVAVGTTNKTYLRDYERAITERTALLLWVHASNFRIVGFTAAPSIGELVELGRRRGLPVMADVGSGALVDFSRWGLCGEPVVGDSVRAGADVVCFSGDKLLGGPQAGILVGKRDVIARIRRHPLFRAVRPDKLQITALEATLRLYLDPDRLRERLPVIAMISMDAAEIERRARALAEAVARVRPWRAEVWDETSQVGGGSMPAEELPTKVVAVVHPQMSPDRIAAMLRVNDPPVFARIVRERVVFDVRTLLEGDADDIVAALRRIAGE